MQFRSEEGRKPVTVIDGGTKALRALKAFDDWQESRFRQDVEMN